MAHIMAQVALHRVIQDGVKIVKQNPDVLDDIFYYYLLPDMAASYGQPYIDNIKKWFTETKIPVVQAWSLNPETAPQIGIKLATEQEDIQNSAIGDYFGEDGEQGDFGVNVMNVQLDVILQTSKNGDECLWLYYIVSYILLKRKRTAERLGLEMYTWSATDYSRNQAKLADNIWERYLRVTTKVQNNWLDREYLDIDTVNIELYGASASVEDDETEKL